MLPTDLTRETKEDLAQSASLVATLCKNLETETHGLISAHFEWDNLWTNLNAALPEFTKTPLGLCFAETVANEIIGGCDLTDSIDSERSDEDRRSPCV